MFNCLVSKDNMSRTTVLTTPSPQYDSLVLARQLVRCSAASTRRTESFVHGDSSSWLCFLPLLEYLDIR